MKMNINEDMNKTEPGHAGRDSGTSAGYVDLLPCPFCGGKPRKILRGNNYTKKRSITIKCQKCRIERTDAAIRFNHEWLDSIATGAWNKRSHH